MSGLKTPCQLRRGCEHKCLGLGSSHGHAGTDAWLLIGTRAQLHRLNQLAVDNRGRPGGPAPVALQRDVAVIELRPASQRAVTPTEFRRGKSC